MSIFKKGDRIVRVHQGHVNPSKGMFIGVTYIVRFDQISASDVIVEDLTGIPIINTGRANGSWEASYFELESKYNCLETYKIF